MADSAGAGSAEAPGTGNDPGPGVSANIGSGQSNPEGLANAKGQGGANPDPKPAVPDIPGQASEGDDKSSGRGSAGIGKSPSSSGKADPSQPTRVSSGNKTGENASKKV